MSSKSQPDLSASVDDLIAILRNFQSELENSDLRQKVIGFIPVYETMTSFGSKFIPASVAKSARDRIKEYFRKYPRTVISSKEIMIVSGISEWARRVRELRVQFGWAIVSGVTAREISDAEDINTDVSSMKPDDYILVSDLPDLEAAHRWHLDNEIRKSKASMQEKILEFLKANVTKVVTGEELRYVANDKAEWARRVRELRTEQGWPILTKSSGRPDLGIGAYVLESVRQSPAHDRKISDEVRSAVLMRDKYGCQNCGWNRELWNKSDPRHLELHHKKHHAKGGDNSAENLITLCTVCHDAIHRKEKGN